MMNLRLTDLLDSLSAQSAQSLLYNLQDVNEFLNIIETFENVNGGK